MTKVLTGVSILLLIFVVSVTASNSGYKPEPVAQTSNDLSFRQTLSRLKGQSATIQRAGANAATGTISYVGNDYIVITFTTVSDYVPFTSILMVRKEAQKPLEIFMK